MAFGQAVPVGVVKAHVEGLEPAQHRQPDAAGRHGSNLHRFEIVRALHAVGDIPAALAHPVM